jgi:hypothetical protein
VALLEKFKDNVISAARNGLRKAADKTQDRLRQNAGLTDHSLKALARMGHPYAKRNPQNIHDPNWLVHRQSGQLQDNIKVTHEGPDAIAIGVDPVAVPHFIDVVEGNSLMVPRNFPFHTLEELKADGTIHKTIEDSLNEAVKKS